MISYFKMIARRYSFSFSADHRSPIKKAESEFIEKLKGWIMHECKQEVGLSLKGGLESFSKGLERIV